MIEIGLLESDNAETCFNRGVRFMESGEFARAEACFMRTRALAPESLETILNLGYALDMQGRNDEALDCYESVLKSSPLNAKARYNRAAHLLRVGDLASGFADYEARFSAMKSADSRNYSQPRWDGSPLKGRSILVYCEQGLGDAIQFARYIPLLAEKGCRVLLEVQQSLISLMTTLAGVEKVVLKSDTPPQTDFHIPLMSLPHLFGTTLTSIPAEIPYLFPPPDKVEFWRELLGDKHDSLRIGLVWAGKPAPDPNRSCPPDFLAPLFSIRGARFYSLQFGQCGHLSLSKEMAAHVIDLSCELGDFAKTAALIANLDLVITIDTVIAHLAGAIGKPVWVMLPFISDWRWMNNCTDSPWYPTMMLFRQPEPGNWGAVVREVTQALRQQLLQQEDESGLSAEMLETKFQQALTAIKNNDSGTAIYELRDLLVKMPDDPAVWFNLARAYDLAGQLFEAEQACRRALSASPDSPANLFALGDILLKQKSYPEAELYLHKAHNLKPESFEILLSLGNVLSSQNKIIEAIGICKKILTLRPECLEVVYNLATLQLRSGDYLAGFVNFEARLAIEKFDIDPRHYPQPRWDGSPLNGRSILIYGEQGVGDVIQFVRYIPLVAERGGKVVFELDPPLIPLLESFPGVDKIVPKSKTPPLTEVYIQLMSLPYILGTTIETVPDRVPYIYPDTAKVIKWRQILGNRPVFRIGLAWRGNPKNPRDKERSCGLDALAPLGGIPNVKFFSLQVGEAALEAASAPTGMDLIDTSSLQTDFSETAALVANLDLVISVDTAVAHLAGAMWRPVWLLLTKGTEWRWLDGRCDTPWYPTMRVFEREQEHGWEEVIGQIRDALERLLAESSGSGQTDIEAVYRLGGALKEAGDLVGAESCFRRIVERQPDLPDPQYSLGVVLQLQGRLPEAISHYRAATALDPGFVKAHYNLANALLHSALYRDAIESAQTAIKYDPMHADAHWLLGMLLLQGGDFSSGWREYEWRWKASGFTSRIPDLGCRQWDGSPLGGRTLLIHMEQGRGDMIQFIRYASLAAGMGGQIVVCALPELVSLLATVAGTSLVVDRNGTLPVFDVHIPVQSLPYVFGTTLETIPGDVPYLRPDPVKVAEWQRMFPDGRRFRIGLVWQGTPTHRDDHNRSCPLNEFVPLSGLAGVDFYSLQIGSGSEQIYSLPECMTVVDLTGRIQDFSDTAAMIANLDLMISVDTAVAHLAGALGKPVWTLLPYVPEWRWLLDRDDSPWYPTMRLFRQAAPGDWKSVFCQLRDELEMLLCSPEKLNQLGICLLKSGSAVRAELAFSRAIAYEPDNAEFHCNRGVALDSLSRYEEAIYCYQEALFCKPDFFNAMFNLGNAYVSINKPEEARACFGRVVEFNQNFTAAYLCLGEVEKRLRNFPLALASFESAIAIDPGCAEAFQGIAEVCQAAERFEDAIVAYGKVLALKPRNAAAINMLGTAYQSIEQLDKAEECYRLALTLTPDKLTVLNNLAVVLNSQGRLEEAVDVYRQLLKIDSGYADGHWNLSVALLALGEYSEGWREFEWRFKKANPVSSRIFSQPLWDGSDLAGRTILLHAEQGFGDTIQFVRYAVLVSQRGGNVIIECQVHALKRLLLSLEGVAGVIVAGDPLPHFDCHLPLMSLPLVFGTTLETIPAHVPYLFAQPADIDKWREWLESRGTIRVGLVWFGRQSQVLNRKRSCPLGTFAQLASVPNIEFYSLQIGEGVEQIRKCDPGFPLLDLTEHVHDFADTAAFISNLDLVVSIDTAVAHLAGALGVHTWILLPYSSDWRWLCGRHDSPWYPTMRLFRQPLQGDWPSLMKDVAGALQAYVHGTTGYRSLEPVNSIPRVGLAWSGRQDNPLNCKRSCPFSALAPLLDLDGITFVKLQMDSAEAPDTRMLDLTGQIRDFADTAALMANLDLIISIDTSVAHLAAASGRPTWVLLSHVADWRWSENRNSCCWYPQVELFRQTDMGDWDGVVLEVVDRLSGLFGICSPMSQPDQPGSELKASAERIRLEQLLKDKQLEVGRNGDCPDAHLDAGAAFALLGRDLEAINAFRKVLELDPGHVAGHLNLAYSLLAIGVYSEGWEHFEWRLKRLPPDSLPPWPMLRRSDIGVRAAGSSVLVHCEQGYGDTIMFSRFLPLLASAGYRVVVSCQPPLATLVASVSGVGRVVPHGEPLPVCDCQVLLLSLPWLFGLDRQQISIEIPYIGPEKDAVEYWERVLEKKMRQDVFFLKSFRQPSI